MFQAPHPQARSLSPSHQVCRGRQKLQGCSICRWPVSILCTTIRRIVNVRKPQASKEISLLIICCVFFLHHLLLLCRIRHWIGKLCTHRLMMVPRPCSLKLGTILGIMGMVVCWWQADGYREFMVVMELELLQVGFFRSCQSIFI